MTLLLNELHAGVEKDGAEAVIGFTGHRPPAAMMYLRGGPVRYPLPFTAGIAFPLGDRVVVRRTEWKKLTRHTLIHEVAHLFGGLHVDDESILEAEADRMSFRLDPFNRRVLDLTRDRTSTAESGRFPVASSWPCRPVPPGPPARRERARHRHPDRPPAHVGR